MPKYKEVEWKKRTNKGYEVTVSSNGITFYLLDGKVHREDGPAVVLPLGSKAWYLNGGKLFKEDFTIEMILKMQASELFTIQELAKLRLNNA